MRVRLLPFALFLAAGCAVAAAQTATDKQERQVEIGLTADKAAITLGEPAYVSLEIKNHTAWDLCLGVGGDYRNNLGRPNSFKVTVNRIDGKAVPQPEVTSEGGGFLGCARAPAHGSHVIKLFLPHWATFEEPGSYTINVKRRFGIFFSKQKSSQEKSSAAVFPEPDLVLEADVSAGIEVLPEDKDKLGETIKFFGSAMLDVDNPEASDAA